LISRDIHPLLILFSLLFLIFAFITPLTSLLLPHFLLPLLLLLFHLL
jgi:hypothetical protein